MGLEFHPGNSSLCILGDYDRERRHLLRDNLQAIDYGTDFYAAQTLAAPSQEKEMESAVTGV